MKRIKERSQSCQLHGFYSVYLHILSIWWKMLTVCMYELLETKNLFFNPFVGNETKD